MRKSRDVFEATVSIEKEVNSLNSARTLTHAHKNMYFEQSIK